MYKRQVTDKGASAVQQQIDEIFVKTAAQVGLDLMDTISKATDSDSAKTAAENQMCIRDRNDINAREKKFSRVFLRS